ncbi:serine hydrolase [Nocardia sp. NPDC059246]|uniref:serine hydrolase n=1 Tax=unclassified Nocardia TaxID=2637762 RepID=UPI00367D2FCE
MGKPDNQIGTLDAPLVAAPLACPRIRTSRNARRRLLRHEFLKSLPGVEPQGVHFNYNSANTQVLAWLLEKVYDQPFNEILSQQLWQPAGMEACPAGCLTGVHLAHTVQFTGDGDFAGQGNAEWHTRYRAVLQQLGGCR